MRVFHYVGMIATLAAMAPVTAKAAQDGITYDCDTAANHYSELMLPAPAVPFSVTGLVKLQAAASFEKYVPMTRLAIAAPADRPGAAPDDLAGFLLSAMPAKALGVKGKDKTAILQFLSWDERNGGKAVSHDPFELTDTSASAPFSLTYDGSVVVTRIGGREQKIPLIAKDPVVRIVCSTGEFLFTKLKIETQK